MKKLLTTITIVACLVSCSKILTDDPITIKVENETPALQEQAIIIPETEDAISFAVNEKDIRAFVKRVEKDRKIRKIESILRENKPLVYVVNYDKGWTIFSSDKHLPPILAENPEGSFDVNRLDNPGVNEWLEGIKEATRKARQDASTSTANEYTVLWEGKKGTAQRERIDKESRSSAYQSSISNYYWTKVFVGQETENGAIEDTGYLLSTNWGQGFPWWNSLPVFSGSSHYYTGCVAVALSQLLYYYHYNIGVPSGLYHNISIAEWNFYPDSAPYYQSTLTRTNYVSPSSRWDQMIACKADYSFYDPASVAGAEYVSNLMLDVGNRVDMYYYADGTGSGSTIGDAYEALPFYGLTATLGVFNDYHVINNIDHQRPLYARGLKQQGGGHAWVIDGYRKHNYTVRNVYEWWLGYLPSLGEGEGKTHAEARAAAEAAGYEKPEDGMVTREFAYNSAYYTYHMNWGWDGSSNGYYSEFSDNLGYSENRQLLYDFRIN